MTEPTELTADDVLEWIDNASSRELRKIAKEIVDRGLATDNEDYAELQSELRASEEAELENDLLQDAADRLRRREYRETLHVLAKALGREFFDLETLPLDGAA